MQDFLTYTIEILFISFFLVASFDFINNLDEILVPVAQTVETTAVIKEVPIVIPSTPITIAPMPIIPLPDSVGSYDFKCCLLASKKGKQLCGGAKYGRIEKLRELKVLV